MLFTHLLMVARLLFFGPPGVLLGPLVTALLLALLEIYRLEMAASKEESGT